MDKDEMKMIEEMATHMVDYCDRFQMCPYDADSNVTCDICKARSLYNANCRIIADDEMVVKKRQYEQLKKYNRDRKRLRLKWQQAKQEVKDTKKKNKARNGKRDFARAERDVWNKQRV